MVVRENEVVQDSQRYQVLLEEVPGLNPSRIEAFLTHQFAEVSAGRFVYPSKVGEEKPCRPLATLSGNASDTLLHAVGEGELKEIALVTKETVDQGLDEAPYIREQEHTVIVKVEPKRSAAEKRRLLARIFDRAKHDRAGEMIVRFTENGKSQSVDVDITADRLEDTLFIKAEMVELEEALEGLNPSIRDDLVEKMLPLFE